MGTRPIRRTFGGGRPGEKIHEILVSEEEVPRAVGRAGWYVIKPMFPELRWSAPRERDLESEFSSTDHVMSQEAVEDLLRRHGLLIESHPTATDHSGN